MLRSTLKVCLLIVISSLFSCHQSHRSNQHNRQLSTSHSEGTQPANSLLFVISHHVNDFGRWLQVFKSNDSLRKTYQLSDPEIFRSLTDTLYVMISLQASSIEKAEAFLYSEAQQAALRAAGVTDTPEINFYEPVFNDDRIARATDLRFFVIYKTQDYTAFKNAFDLLEEERKHDGLALVTIARKRNHPNEIAMAFTAEDFRAMDRHLSKSSVQQTLEQAKLTSAPEVIIALKVAHGNF
ncbi:MAG: hypothetical protein KatS3mg031_0113 [Chitinophagales bacterium]|nr:MAG: hypothetical protein KatS3mg031_0113 [Chitinophagales bacterium]